MTRAGNIVDINKLETQMTQTLHELAGQQQKDASANTGANIGQLTADAVMAQYEAAAKSVEEMGTSVKQRIAGLEKALAECHADMKLLKEAAFAIAEKGKLAAAEVERTAAVSRDIRDVVAQIRERIA